MDILRAQYPFIKFLNRAVTKEYLFNGKEIQEELGLNLYDYEFRFYDPVIARWSVPDPLAEYAYNYSPYNYVKNNPINYIDLFGLSDTTYIAPEPIPEVVVTYTPPPKPRSPDFISILYAIDDFLMGNHNPVKIHDANWF
ncbi:MAG: RHS repeat-associated core domain-containing protein [Bacteroidota bacterium]|nr:RHS repeat-associated core domain-containing protein [Bacteroidota bacterium]